jgi:serine/threonine protein kinase
MGCIGSSEKKDRRPTDPPKQYGTTKTDPPQTPETKAVDPVKPQPEPTPEPPKQKTPVQPPPAGNESEGIMHEPIEDAYTLGREIGKGGFSVVVEATNKKTGQRVAVKRIKKDQVPFHLIIIIHNLARGITIIWSSHLNGRYSPVVLISQVEGDDIKLLLREVQIMRGLDHPNILKLYEVYESEEEFFLIMELVTGKERMWYTRYFNFNNIHIFLVFDKIVDKGQYSEKEAANIVRQIVSAVAYLHDHGIAHRDLKVIYPTFVREPSFCWDRNFKIRSWLNC